MSVSSLNERQFTICTFGHKRDVSPKEREVTWTRFVTMLQRRDVRQDKDGPLYSPVSYDGPRKKENVREVYCLTLDFDKGMAPGGLMNAWKTAGYAFAVYSTFQHTNLLPRFRAVFPLSRSVPADEWDRVYSYFAKELGQGHTDPSCSDASRMHYFASCPPETESQAFFFDNDGEPLDVDAIPEETPAEPVPPVTRAIVAPPRPAPPSSSSRILTDADILDICSKAKNSAKFLRLYNGDAGGYDSARSGAVFALAEQLIFYTHSIHGEGDGQLERMLLNSGFADYFAEKPHDLPRVVRRAVERAGTERYTRSGSQSVLQRAVVTETPTGTVIQSASASSNEPDESEIMPALPGVLPCIAHSLRGLPAKVNEWGLTVSPEASEDERRSIMRSLMALNRHASVWMRFAIGDAYNALPGEYGVRKKWVNDNFGAGNEKKVSGWAYVAGQWKGMAEDGKAHRRMNPETGDFYEWSFYDVTAPLSVSEQSVYQKRWQDPGERLSIAKIKEEKREGRHRQDDIRRTEFVSCLPKDAEALRELKAVVQARGADFVQDKLRALIHLEYSAVAAEMPVPSPLPEDDNPYSACDHLYTGSSEIPEVDAFAREHEEHDDAGDLEVLGANNIRTSGYCLDEFVPPSLTPSNRTHLISAYLRVFQNLESEAEAGRIPRKVDVRGDDGLSLLRRFDGDPNRFVLYYVGQLRTMKDEKQVSFGTASTFLPRHVEHLLLLQRSYEGEGFVPDLGICDLADYMDASRQADEMKAARA